MTLPGGFDPNNAAGQLMRQKEALARQDDLKRSSAGNASKHGLVSARSALIEVAVIVGAIAGVSIIAGVLLAIF